MYYVLALLCVLGPAAVLAECDSSYLGDGWCDAECNRREHKFDDGDCCESTCTAAAPRVFPCGIGGYDCHITQPIPSWFEEDTQLCYKWQPDGDGGQCGSGVEGRELCAAVGSRTQVYRDNTDSRGGGCMMRWGIRSPYAPNWFRYKVRLCYRWYADSSEEQCGGGAPAAMCASINTFTPQYRDDTNDRSGGCRMSWKLSIPSDSPQWLRDVQLCYHWYPDGDGGQCGGGEARDLCAVANTWTTYYRDDTDGRAGGCRMSWELKTTSTTNSTCM